MNNDMKWLQSNGEYIRFKDMSHNHLYNVIGFLKRDIYAKYNGYSARWWVVQFTQHRSFREINNKEKYSIW